MSDVALPGSIEPAVHKGPELDKSFHPLTGVIYLGVVAAALLFVAYSIYADIDATGTKVTTYTPFILLFVALLIALGFEFVNGFHDTTNAVATVISPTRCRLKPRCCGRASSIFSASLFPAARWRSASYRCCRPEE